jgi:ElaB/YqjD/DUF883 family membrane-anchored ribosome-binding protein
LGLLLALLACEKKPKEKEETKIAAPTETVKKESEDAIEELKSYAKKKHEEFRDKAEAKLKFYEERVNELKAKADKATGEAKKKIDEALEAFREKQKALTEQLDKFKTASAKAWEEMEKKIDAGLEELKKHYERARSAMARKN